MSLIRQKLEDLKGHNRAIQDGEVVGIIDDYLTQENIGEVIDLVNNPDDQELGYVATILLFNQRSGRLTADPATRQKLVETLLVCLETSKNSRLRDGASEALDTAIYLSPKDAPWRNSARRRISALLETERDKDVLATLRDLYDTYLT